MFRLTSKTERQSLEHKKRENIIGVKTRVGIYFPLIKNSLILESIKQKISITQNAMDMFVDAFGDSG